MQQMVSMILIRRLIFFFKITSLISKLIDAFFLESSELVPLEVRPRKLISHHTKRIVVPHFVVTPAIAPSTRHFLESANGSF